MDRLQHLAEFALGTLLVLLKRLVGDLHKVLLRLQERSVGQRPETLFTFLLHPREVLALAGHGGVALGHLGGVGCLRAFCRLCAAAQVIPLGLEISDLALALREFGRELGHVRRLAL